MDEVLSEPRIVLASGSPRRKELMEREGIQFEVRVSHVDESLDADQMADPFQAAQLLAQRKSKAVLEEMLEEGAQGMLVVIGADTMVVHEGEIFGKPCDVAHAAQMLSRLSGNTHEVVTGVCVWLALVHDDDVSVVFRSFGDCSKVRFNELDDALISSYLEDDEYSDKAGAYAVQGRAGKLFVQSIAGDIDTVIGLPVSKLLSDFGDVLRVSHDQA